MRILWQIDQLQHQYRARIAGVAFGKVVPSLIATRTRGRIECDGTRAGFNGFIDATQ